MTVGANDAASAALGPDAESASGVAVSRRSLRSTGLRVARFASVLVGAGLLLRTGAADQAISAVDEETAPPIRHSQPKAELPRPAFGSAERQSTRGEGKQARLADDDRPSEHRAGFAAANHKHQPRFGRDADAPASLARPASSTAQDMAAAVSRHSEPAPAVALAASPAPLISSTAAARPVPALSQRQRIVPVAAAPVAAPAPKLAAAASAPKVTDPAPGGTTAAPAPAPNPVVLQDPNIAMARSKAAAGLRGPQQRSDIRQVMRSAASSWDYFDGMGPVVPQRRAEAAPDPAAAAAPAAVRSQFAADVAPAKIDAPAKRTAPVRRTAQAQPPAAPSGRAALVAESGPVISSQPTSARPMAARIRPVAALDAPSEASPAPATAPSAAPAASPTLAALEAAPARHAPALRRALAPASDRHELPEVPGSKRIAGLSLAERDETQRARGAAARPISLVAGGKDSARDSQRDRLIGKARPLRRSETAEGAPDARQPVPDRTASAETSAGQASMSLASVDSGGISLRDRIPQPAF